jgi:tyrosine-protein phosphatase OCA6
LHVQFLSAGLILSCRALGQGLIPREGSGESRVLAALYCLVLRATILLQAARAHRLAGRMFSSPPAAPRPMPPLIPPFRYANVEDGVYRGAHPSLRNFRFIRRLHLRTLILILPEQPSSDIEQFCTAERITLIYRRADKYDDGDAISMTPALISSLLELLVDPARHPVYITCRDGGHHTGLVIMCLRRLQHWTNSAIHEEHRRYTKVNEIHYQEEQFVEAFSGPVTLPGGPIPRWLWNGVRISAHPAVKLVAPAPVASTSSIVGARGEVFGATADEAVALFAATNLPAKATTAIAAIVSNSTGRAAFLGVSAESGTAGPPLAVSEGASQGSSDSLITSIPGHPRRRLRPDSLFSLIGDGDGESKQESHTDAWFKRLLEPTTSWASGQAPIAAGPSLSLSGLALAGHDLAPPSSALPQAPSAVTLRGAGPVTRRLSSRQGGKS